MTTSSHYINGVLTIMVGTHDHFVIEWQAPLEDATFDKCASMVLRHMTAMAAHQERSLRDLLAEGVVECYTTYASGPDDKIHPANIAADNQLKVFLKLFADHVASSHFTFFVSKERIVKIHVETLPTPEAEAKTMIEAALLAEGAQPGNRSPL
ncbi:hypothetical protein JKG68_27235 [Microvirga aerilata]|uniref:Uncharacterized protein n=1 Tax=Microvirga aerilata TaxID=670292 RepID=A0A936ZBD3_9HYPH|nr:hypothetical protein [Microvirga aerilata]MBL0407616.1 hypothetical protein [Microvirga aerilata]